jgi:hypothetical protein
MSEATLILPNMRGGCATVGATVHALFRVSNRSHRPMAQPDAVTSGDRPRREDQTSALPLT